MECIKIHVNGIEGRLDPIFYAQINLKNEEIIKENKWGYKRIKDISKRIVDGPFGSQLKVEEYHNAGIPLIRVSNVKTGKIEGDFVYISKEKQLQLKRSRVLPRDVLLTKAGAILGYSAVFPKQLKEGNITSHLVTITCNKEIIPEYLAIFFRSRFGQLQIYRWGNKSTRPELNTSEVERILIPTPPLNIQKYIIEIIENAYKLKKQKKSEAQKLFDSINDYVLDELGIKLPELKNKMAYVVSSDEVQNTRTDAYYYQPKFEEIEKAVNNGKFEAKELKNFIEKIHYGASVKNEYVDEGIPLLRILNIKENKVVLRDVVKLPESMRKELGNAFVKEGDLLISRSGTVGIVAVIPKEAEGYAFGSFMIKFCLNDKINKNYVSAWLNTKLQKLLTEREKIGAIQGNITIGTIESFRIPLPPLAFQNKIAEEVKKRMEKAEKLQKEAKEELERAKLEVEKIIIGD